MANPKQTSVAWKPWLYAILASLIGLAVEQMIEQFQRERFIDHEHQHVANELAGLRARLEGEINGNLLMVRGLSAVIAAQPGLDQESFARIADGMIGGGSAIRNIAGAPGLVIRLMHPVAGNEAAIGLDYRTHPEQRETALRAAETGDIVVAGPLELVQGGVALVARYPVYPAPQQLGGERPLWGLVSAVIDIDRFYEQAGVTALAAKAQLALAIRGRDGIGSAGDVFYGDAALFDNSPVLAPIALPSGSWQIAAIPSDGWGSHLHADELVATRILGLALTALFAVFAYTVAAKKHQLQQTAEQLRDSQALFSGFLDNLPAGAFVQDPGAGQMLFENRWLKAHPPGAERLGGDNVSLAALRETPQLLRGEIETTDGTGISLETLHFALGRNTDRDLIGGVVMDVSERVRAEQALVESEERLRLALEAANQGLYDLDLDAGEALVSPEYARMLGYDPKTFRESQAAWRERLHPDDVQRVREVFDDYIAGRIPEYRVEFRQRTRDGAWRWILSHGKIQARDAAGRPRRMLGTHTDITALREGQIALEKARDELEERVEQRTRELQDVNHELEAFTYSVSHDLKAPLRGIDGYSRLLLEDYSGRLDDEGKLFLNNVRRGVETMTQLIEDLLAYSRMERRSVQKAPLSIDLLIDAVVSERRDDIEARGVQLEVDAESITVEADADGIKLALRNLLDNALKFTAKINTPLIRISAHTKQRGIELTVIDNGIGFDMRFHDRIFDIFQRLQRSEDYPGTGIGLAIVRKAMQRMGGSIRARSEPGKGASFILDIPQ